MSVVPGFLAGEHLAGLGRTVGAASRAWDRQRQALAVEVAYRHFQHFGQLPQAGRRHAVGRTLVFLDLLETDPAGASQLLLGEAQDPTPTPKPPTQMNIDAMAAVITTLTAAFQTASASCCGTARRLVCKLRRRNGRVALLLTGVVRKMYMVNRDASLGQEIVWRLEVMRLRPCRCAFGPIVSADRSGFGFRGLAVCGLSGPLTSANRVAREINLRIAFPQADDAQIAALLAAQWRELGRWFAEFPILDRIIADPDRVEIVGAERLAAIRDGAGPVVFVSGHFASFEIDARGDRPRRDHSARSPIARRTTLISTSAYAAARWRYGVRLFAPKGTEGARELLVGPLQGAATMPVALMNDQKFNAGIAAPLSGVTVHTAPGPCDASPLKVRCAAAADERAAQRKGALPGGGA